MASPISQLRDDFADNIVASTWGNAGILGSGAYAETGGQAVCSLPSSAAGSHQGAYQTSGTYDLTSDQFVWNINTMVATGVAATAYFQLMSGLDGANQLYWRQVSNVITARTVVAGVDTQLFTAAWSAATYKYLRIRESAGTIFWDSSTNGTTWTGRAALANPFAVTSLYVQFAAACGNVASPGSLKLDDVNLILPAVSSVWRWTQDEWPLSYRFRPITLAIDTANTVQGYIAVASSIDSSGNLVSPVYYSGPLGSASGGYNALTLAASQAAAQAMAVNLPLDGRWDLPSIVECRFIRLYHRSTDASAHTLREYYPRRIVQSDDVEAESMQTINLAAGSVTADKIFVLNLAAVSAYIGQLSIDPTGWIYQGSGTGAAPATGLKIFNSGGIGKLSTYNAGIEQVTFDTDGKLKAGAGNVVLDAGGISITSAVASSGDPIKSYKFNIAGVEAGGMYGFLSGTQNTIDVLTQALTGKSSRTEIASFGLGTSSTTFARTVLSATANASVASLTLTADPIGGGVARDMTAIADGITLSAATFISLTGPVTVTGALNTSVINATGAVHTPRSSGSALFGIDGTDMGAALTIANTATAQPFGGVRNFSGLLIISETAVNGNCAMFLVDGGGTITLIGTAGASWSITAGTASKTNVYLVSGVVTIENRLGSTATYNIMAQRTRSS